MQGDDNNPELPPAEVPMDLPPAEPEVEAASIEPKEFLVTDAEHSVDPAQFDAAPGGEQTPGGEEAGAGEATSTSVDDMLSAEILPEGLDGAAMPEPAAALPEGPTFQLLFRSLSNDARPALKKALDALGVPLSDKVWSAAIPVVSHLTEFQGIALLQAAHALGVAAEVTVAMPHPLPTEEDLALGDLSLVPDLTPPILEAAPSVTLPKGEKEVLLCTPESLPGGTVRESFGIVMAHRSIARRLFREEDLREKLQKELRAVPKGSVPLPSSQLQILLRELLLDLRKFALAKGANSVLGVKLEAFPESGLSDPQLEQLRLVAFGTAAVVEKA